MDTDQLDSGSVVMEEEGEGRKILVVEKSSSFDDTKVEVDGGVGCEGAGVTGAAKEAELLAGEGKLASFDAKVNGELAEQGEVKGSTTKWAELPVNDGGSKGTGASPATKGKGLKKWRRIKRDATKVAASSADFGRTLKREPAVLEEPTKSRDDNRHKSDVEGESSVASFDIENLGSGSVDIRTFENSSNDITNLDFGPPESGSNLGCSATAIDPELAEFLASGVGFSVGADSDNSEERSSKSSTAASAPSHKHEWFGFGRERIGTKNLSGKGSGQGVQQRGSRGKVRPDSSKKTREDRAGFRKENSPSSIDSDSRSTNAIFAQWGSTSSNGRHVQEFANHNCDHSGKVQGNDALEVGYYKENGRAEEEFSQEASSIDGGHMERRGDETFHSNSSQDPLNESILLLQEAQEALEKEIVKFEDIGENSMSVTDNPSDQSYLQEIKVNDSPPQETRLIYLTKKVEYLESELKEASKKVQSKELEFLEQERVLNETQQPNNKTENKDLPLKGCKEMENELEDLFRRNLEIEIECSALRNTLKHIIKQLFTLFEEHKSLLEDYDQLVVKHLDAKDEAIALKELEASHEELLGSERLLVLQNRVCNYSLCFFLQLVMLFSAFWLLFFRLSASSDEAVPT